MLAISTAWRSEILDSGKEIVEDILDLGVKALEMEYRVSLSDLKEMEPYLRDGRMTVTSVHNIFPLPRHIPKSMANGEFVSLSSTHDRERKSAVAYTLKTMEWAKKLGAGAVVLHMGRASMDGVMGFLIEAYNRGMTGTREGKAFIAEHKEVRGRLGKPLLEAALKSLQTLAGEAQQQGILLGIENRYNIQDFPGLEEFKVIFREFRNSPIRYWHDMGHATTQENLGLVAKGELLENFGGLLLGTHLHGCRGYHDHYAPGSGEEDYSLLKKFLKPETLRVVEAHSRTTREELLRGLEFLKEEGIT
jgi:sugar phosphate isomerase/epimerase